MKSASHPLHIRRKTIVTNLLLTREHATQVEEIRALLDDKGGSVAERDVEWNQTPLITACANECRPDVIDFLINRGSDVNAVNCLGETAFLYATTKPILQSLIRAGANVHHIANVSLKF